MGKLSEGKGKGKRDFLTPLEIWGNNIKKEGRMNRATVDRIRLVVRFWKFVGGSVEPETLKKLRDFAKRKVGVRAEEIIRQFNWRFEERKN